jgi:protein ImuB
MYACLYAQQHATAPGDLDLTAVLLAVAREFSPRVEPAGPGAVVCDLSGLERLFGDAKTIAGELRREAADRGVPSRVATAGTRTAALVAAHAHPGITVIEPGGEAAALAPLPVRLLDVFLDLEVGRIEAGAPSPSARFYRTSPMQEVARRRVAARRRPRASLQGASREALDRHERLVETLGRWGIGTLGALAALPRNQVAARFGKDGPRLQRLARGDDDGPLVPVAPEERFEAHLDLEWPIEGLEPLSFVLGRLLEPICAHLERRDRAAAALVVELRLVSKDTFTRRLPLPAPIRDARALRTLAMLDLDAHPPGAGIDAVTVRVEPTPGRVLQHSLLERAQAAPEQLSTLVARLGALMGPDRVGSPQVPDSFRPGAFVMQPFAVDRAARRPGASACGPAASACRPGASAPGSAETSAPVPPLPALRRFRHPVPVRVALEAQRPARVSADRPGVVAGHVDTCAGPWHTSGAWWNDGWDRDEWDLALEDGTICRVYQDRATRVWFMEGVVD